MRLLALLIVSATSAYSAVPNAVKIINESEITQSNRPVSVSRPFVQGEVRACALAEIEGAPLASQCDVKNRWPDGSLKFAVVSFVVPSLSPGETAEVAFVETECVESVPLSQNEMLSPSFDFDVEIEVSNSATETVSARNMLVNGKYRYWLRGPIVTAVILEDRTPTRAHDMDAGAGDKPLHPIIEAWFYPGLSNVSVGATLENCWAASNDTNSMKSVSYALEIRGGESNPAVQYSESTFADRGRTRWHKRFWLNGDPPELRVDYNLAYLCETKFIANYDASIIVSNSLLASTTSRWFSAVKTIGSDGGGKHGFYEKHLTSGGQHDWVGLLNTWDTLYLFTMRNDAREIMLENADLAGRIPVHFREADNRAGSGQYFDEAFVGSVETFGRPVSINARRTINFDYLDNNDQRVEDRIRYQNLTGEGWQVLNSHLPPAAYLAYVMSGRFYYLEEVQFWGAHALGANNGAYAPWARQGDAGYYNSQVRGDAWALRSSLYAAIVSPDESPEHDYFDDKIRNNLAKWEGEHHLPITDTNRWEHYWWGYSNRVSSAGVSPLGMWQNRGGGMVESPLKQDGSLEGGASPWEENFLTCSLGMARQFGYPSYHLLEFMARRPFNLLLNPDVSPYFVEAYRYPTIVSSNSAWVQNWAEYADYYASVPSGWTMSADADNGYGFIALGSLSFLYDIEVDGYSGKDAWEFYYPQKPLKNLYATKSQKFAMLPRTNGSEFVYIGALDSNTGELSVIGDVGWGFVVESSADVANWSPVVTGFQDEAKVALTVPITNHAVLRVRHTE